MPHTNISELARVAQLEEAGTRLADAVEQTMGPWPGGDIEVARDAWRAVAEGQADPADSHGWADAAAEAAVVERVARALYAEWCAHVGQPRTWDELLVDPDAATRTGHRYGDALTVYRRWARKALAAAAGQETTR